VYQPGSKAGAPQADADRVARVSRWVQTRGDVPNLTDGVIAELTIPQWSPDVYAFGRLTKAGKPEKGAYVQTVGRSALLKLGRVVQVGASIRIADTASDRLQELEFTNLFAIKTDDESPFSRPGDGGAPVLALTGELVGMVFGGSHWGDRDHTTYALPINGVLDALGVDLVVSAPPPPLGREK
jgi:hypothetical protein